MSSYISCSLRRHVCTGQKSRRYTVSVSVHSNRDVSASLLLVLVSVCGEFPDVKSLRSHQRHINSTPATHQQHISYTFAHTNSTLSYTPTPHQQYISYTSTAHSLHTNSTLSYTPTPHQQYISYTSTAHSLIPTARQ